MEVPPGYKNVQDLTKRFPDCCVKLVKIDEVEKKDEVENKTEVEKKSWKTNSEKI